MQPLPASDAYVTVSHERCFRAGIVSDAAPKRKVVFLRDISKRSEEPEAKNFLDRCARAACSSSPLPIKDVAFLMRVI